MLVQRAALDQRAEMLFECVAAGPGQLDGLADGDAAALPASTQVYIAF